MSSVRWSPDGEHIAALGWEQPSGQVEPRNHAYVVSASSGALRQITPDDELTLVHEYVHSYQDGRWNIEELNRLAEKDDDDNSSSEFATTVSCIIEGDATLYKAAAGV